LVTPVLSISAAAVVAVVAAVVVATTTVYPLTPAKTLQQCVDIAR